LHALTTDEQELLERLKRIVSDAPSLTAIIDRRLKLPEANAQLRRMQADTAKHTKQAEQDEAKAHESWETFWREIARDPEAAFTADRSQNTAWNLWRAVERSGRESRASGWNRGFIEEQFSKAVADRVREAMMAAWRRDRPTLRSERSDGEKDTFLVSWQFGLAGIAAEAEVLNWAKRLTEQEAELACRYAPLELNGFPSWLESLAVEHPVAVDHVLGQQLSLSLREATDTSAYSMFLQNVSYASDIIAALFVPRIRVWLSEDPQVDASPDNPQAGQNLRQAIAPMSARSCSVIPRVVITSIMKLACMTVLPGSSPWARRRRALDGLTGRRIISAVTASPRRTGACEIRACGQGQPVGEVVRLHLIIPVVVRVGLCRQCHRVRPFAGRWPVHLVKLVPYCAPFIG